MTAPLHTGWRVVCPDGGDRHCPYINHGDARFDAKVYDQHGMCCNARGHKVEPHAYQIPQPAGQS